MKQLISFNTEFFEKRKFQQDDQDGFLLAIAKILLVFLVLFLVWNGYFHYKDIIAIRGGISNEDVKSLTEPYFYYIRYAVSGVGIGLVIWWMKRLKKHV